ncbi:MAG: citramalate synthase [Spirochaetales bacterium]|nr:citramalate synthase [Spirochaetales bacterium]
MKHKKILVYDTTLRDGMQGIEVNYTLEDKIQIAHMLDEMHIDYIEGGFPLSNSKELEFFRRVKNEKFEHAKIVSFGSTRRPGRRASEDPNIAALIDAETDVVTIVGKTWKAHVEQVLNTTPSENVNMFSDSIAYLKSRGKEVIVDYEHFFDGFKDDAQYALKLLEMGTREGADALILCDTNGGTMPNEVTDILRSLPLEKLAPVGVHFHNDCGTADSNSLLSVLEGVVHVQGTINGWGERSGNANLCVIVPNICLKTDFTTAMCSRLKRLTSLSRYISEKANIIPDKRQPYVGEAAFSHKAGQHADVISKAARLMEHIDGSVVGNERRIILSELAGKSTIVRKMSRYGDFSKNSRSVRQLLDILKSKENFGYEYEAAEASFDLLIRKHIDKYSSLFELNNYHLESYKTGDVRSKTVGRIFLTHNGKQIMGAGVGFGPVETLDMAIRDALLPFQPFLEKIHLIDYRVRVLNPEAATASKVRVFVTSTDHERTWDTVGVSENIIEASWEALVDSFDYYYNNFVLENGRE